MRKNVLSMLGSLPFIIIFSLIAEPFLSLPLKQALYAISLLVKSGILFMIPLMIVCVMFKSFFDFKDKSHYFLGALFLCVCSSNFITTLTGGLLGLGASFLSLAKFTFQNPENSLTPLWSLEFKSPIPNEWALISGMLLGAVAFRISPGSGNTVLQILKRILRGLTKSVEFVLPFLIIGFIIKIKSEGHLTSFVKDYSVVFLMIALGQLVYIFGLYLLTAEGNASKALRYMKNMLPAGLSGLVTMSSAVSLPLTLQGTEKNSQNKDIAKGVVSSISNIHLVGDCIGIPVLAYAVLQNFNFPLPDFVTYLIFAFFFMVAKFSVAAVPGGGILVMTPILEKYLGFTTEMSLLITTLYILLDPIITCANIFGNGALALLIEKVLNPIFKKNPS